MTSIWCAFCGTEMTLVYLDDTGSGTTKDGYSLAYNLYACLKCLTICKEQLWDFKGRFWVCSNGLMFRESNYD